MPITRAGLAAKLDRELSIGNFHLILLNAPSGFQPTDDLATILQYEPLATWGYTPPAYTYTSGTSSYNATSGLQETPVVTVQFNATTTYSYTHIGLIQGRGATPNRTVASIDLATDVLTIPSHGLVDGDRGFVTGTDSNPGGLTIQRYYVKVLTSTTIELHTSPALNAKANITNAGSGLIRFRYANGNLWDYKAESGVINAGNLRSVEFIYRKSA